MLQACLNGGLGKSAHPGVPISPSELASDAVAVRAAGADELHLHIRDKDGTETLEPSRVAICLTAVRSAVPGMSVGVGTGAWISPGGVLRHAHIADWTECPDYASVNLNEVDAPEVMELLERKGVGIEAGLWNQRDAEKFVTEIEMDKCLRVLVEMTSSDPRVALDEARAVLSILKRANCQLPVLLHGEAGSVWACVAEAWGQGLSTRVGFEDGLLLPDGTSASSNADLIRAAHTLRRL